MAGTTTVRLDDDDEALLDELSKELGGQSSALRQGLRRLAADRARNHALAEFIAEWNREDGALDKAEITAMVSYYDL